MWGRIIVWGSLVVGLALLVAGVGMRVWPDVSMGKRLAENNCGVCHDLTVAKNNAKGPFLWGVVDRPAGAVDFPFSAAFLDVAHNKPFFWNEANLKKFITDPSIFIPSTRMAQRDKNHPLAFEGIESAANRRDVIAYLSTLK